MRDLRLRFTLLVSFVALCLCSSAQDFSNKGKEFWLAYCYHVGMINAGGPPTMTLYLTSDLATTYSIEIFGGPNLQTGTIAPGQVVTAIVPPNYFINDEGSFINKAVHVTSAKPIVVYSYITRSQASGATLCLPTSVLGKEYYSMNFTQVSNEPNSNSYVTIVAIEDNTTVEITPAAITKDGWLPNTVHSINLNKGDIYQVLGQLDPTDGSAGEDLTGTHIKSVASGAGGCKKIAVFSGSGKVRIPGNCDITSADNLYQQLYPTGSWGLKYLTAPSYNNPNNYYRIAKSNPAANVFVNGVLVLPGSFSNGIWYQFFNNTPNLIQSDMPISVAQYFTTQGCDGNGAPYDPDMIILNPVEQNIDKVTLVSSNLYAPGEHDHHLQVIIPNGGTATSSFKLDGSPVTGWTVHPADSRYSYLYLGNVNQGYHTLSSDSGFNALAYGYATAESYGYSAGANVKDLYQFISIKNQYAAVNFPAGCKNSPFNFSMTFPYQPTQITWNFSGLFPDTTLAAPTYDSTWTVNGRQLYQYRLPDTYSIPAAGTYPIQVLAQNPTSDGCSGDQEIDYDLQVFDPPVADFSFTSNGCFTDSVHFTRAVSSEGRSITSQLWNFGDGNTASAQNPAHLYTAANSFLVKYSVITDVGCVSDTIKKTIPIIAPPVASFSISSPVCENKAISFIDHSTITSGAAIDKWTWDFGDQSSLVISANGSQLVHIYTKAATNTASLWVQTASGCRSLVATKQIIVNPNPVAGFNFTNACLPGGTSNFTDASTIPSGLISEWTWDFGDGTNANGQSISHNYSSTGPFNVRLTVTSAAGCSDDSLRIMDKIYAQPVAAFTAPAEICLGVPIAFADHSIAANSSITQWSWNFGDGSNSAEQNPTKTFTRAGTYPVILAITSAAGCTSAAFTKNVIIDDLPTAGFNFSNPNCVNQAITFSDASQANSGTITSWTWNFGDGNQSILNNGNSFSHVYSDVGSNNVTLQVKTDKGCTSIAFSSMVAIHPLPLANFGLPGSCLNDPFSLFSDSSQIIDNTSNLFQYQWNFGDANANAGNPNLSVQKDPKHRYTATGSYTVSETVTSNNGCVSSATKTFFVNGSVPLPSFQLQENNLLCSGDSVHLTDNSTVSPGKVIRIEIYWDYSNDPSMNTIDENPSPGKIYSHFYNEFNSPDNKIVTIHYVAYSGQTCVQSIDKTITLLARPAVQFTSIQGLCKNSSAFQLNEASVLNGLPGKGDFSGIGVSSTGMFTPALGRVGINNIHYVFAADNGCTNSADQTIELFPVPGVDAGPDKFVLSGGEIALTPRVQANDPVSYSWTPTTWLNDPQTESPMSKPLDDILYRLTVTSDKGCKDSDQVFVKLLKAPQIPNIFSPNGDGVHDKWEIPYLESYPGCTVDIYNRYGQLIFHSVGYGNPWDGRVNGNPAPVGTYYYIIDPKNGRQKISGYVDIIR